MDTTDKVRIAITGHTRGLGKCLYDKLAEQGHDVNGFSRSNGYDISDPEARQQIVNESQDADIFINNAWPNGDPPMNKPEQFIGQTELLKLMIGVWDKEKDKKILNISSKASFNSEDVNYFLENYGKAKREQNKIIEDRINTYGPHILNVILGCTNTQISEYFEGKKIDPAELSQWLIKMLMCETMYFQSVTVDAPRLDYKPDPDKFFLLDF
jgi:nucleoside-diphosphate-sugar epimerase